MQTSNSLYDSGIPEQNVNNPLDAIDSDSLTVEEKRQVTQQGLVLLQQLQMTLDIDKQLKLFSLQAARYLNFSSLYFKSKQINRTLLASKKATKERQFDLKLNNEFIGTLSYGMTDSSNEADCQQINVLHQYLMPPLKNALQYNKAIELAMHDSLTCLGNRRYFDEQLKRAMHNATRQKTTLGLILADLNEFKSINDKHGHLVGDNVLKKFAKIAKKCVRDSDSIFRFGGDEFAILVENADDNALIIIENRLHKALKSNALMSKYNVSSSLGSTYMNSGDNKTSIFNRADSALYQHKATYPCKLKVV
ncbi:MAG: GGDEF domain-containing protein [Colwellia sp.]